MRRTDLAYVAGIIDGEGCISLHLNKVRKYYSYRLLITVTNTNEWLIQWLKLAFGGNASPMTVPNGNKPTWRWNIVSNQALEFLKLIFPYLRIKKPQAELAIKFQEARPKRGHRMASNERVLAEADRILMAKWNRRGAEKWIT